MLTVEVYQGYEIEYLTMYSLDGKLTIYNNRYTVHFCGDDLPFDSIEEARSFIDEIVD